jgi:hypothetical protein
MSREAFMQDWQQTFVNERGGSDGQNLNKLVAASHVAHQRTNPATRNYNEIRTVRAVLLGAFAFETLCQDLLIEQGLESVPPVTPYADVVSGIEPSIIARLAPPFEGSVAEYMAAFKMRAGQDGSDNSSSGFSFYESAYSSVRDDYWKARIADGRYGNDNPATARKAWQQSLDFNRYVSLSLFGDNVSASVDILIAMGASLCLAKRRVCRAEELNEYIVGNARTATAVVSTSQHQQKGPRAALPFEYGYRVLGGDEATLKGLYVHAVQEEDGWHAYWDHPSLQKGSKPHPGHCPASDDNLLHPRTDEELVAVEASLADLGLSGLLEDSHITSAQLAISKALRVSRESVFQESEWQERLLHAHA